MRQLPVLILRDHPISTADQFILELGDQLEFIFVGETCFLADFATRRLY